MSGIGILSNAKLCIESFLRKHVVCHVIVGRSVSEVTEAPCSYVERTGLKTFCPVESSPPIIKMLTQPRRQF